MSQPLKRKSKTIQHTNKKRCIEVYGHDIDKLIPDNSYVIRVIQVVSIRPGCRAYDAYAILSTKGEYKSKNYDRNPIIEKRVWDYLSNAREIGFSQLNYNTRTDAFVNIPFYNENEPHFYKQDLINCFNELLHIFHEDKYKITEWDLKTRKMKLNVF